MPPTATELTVSSKTVSCKDRVSCPECGKLLSGQSSLRSHRRDVHERRCHPCPICGREFSSDRSLKRHRRNVHEKLVYSCEECGRTFGRDGFLYHQKYAHVPKQHPCPECGKLFASPRDVKLHHRIHEKIPLPSSPSNLESPKHVIKEKTQTLKFQNKKEMPREKVRGEKGFQNQQTCQMSAEPILCNICGKNFSREYNLKRHMLCVHKSSLCNICGKTFSRKCNLRRHMLCVHKQVDSPSPDSCSGSEAESEAELFEEHQQEHEDDTKPAKPFLCEICGRSFTRKYDMTRHKLNVHKQDDSPSPDSSSGSEAESEAELFEEHQQEHDDDTKPAKPFLCEICGRSFTRKYHVTRHKLNVHKQDDSPSPDSSSSSEAESEAELFEELRQEHEDDTKPAKPFLCEICGRSFTRKSHVTRHKLNLHKQDDYSSPDSSSSEAEEAESLELHQQVHKEGDNESKLELFSCPICGAQLTRKYSVKVHCMRIHNSSPGFPIEDYLSFKTPPHLSSPTCSSRPCKTAQQSQQPGITRKVMVSAKSNRRRSRREIHCSRKPNNNQRVTGIAHSTSFRRKACRPYECPHCSRRFFKWRGYSEHSCASMIVSNLPHNPFVPIEHPLLAGYKCSLCGVVLQSVRSFNSHVSSHAGLGPYKCTVCDERFTSSRQRKLHNRIVHDSCRGPIRRPQLSKKKVTLSCFLLGRVGHDEAAKLQRGNCYDGALVECSESLQYTSPVYQISRNGYGVTSSPTSLPESCSTQLSILTACENISVGDGVICVDDTTASSGLDKGEHCLTEHHLLDVEEERRMMSILQQSSQSGEIDVGGKDRGTSVVTIEDAEREERHAVEEEEEGDTEITEGLQNHYVNFEVVDEELEGEIHDEKDGDEVGLKIPVDVQVIDSRPFSDPDVVHTKYGKWDLVIF